MKEPFFDNFGPSRDGSGATDEVFTTGDDVDVVSGEFLELLRGFGVGGGKDSHFVAEGL